MLNRKRLLIIGGDERYLSTISLLGKIATEIFVVGFTEIEFGNEKIHHVPKLDEAPFEKVDAIVLPVSGTNSNGEVTLSYPKNFCKLTKDLIQSTPSHCVIITGVSNDFLNKICIEADRDLVAIFERDDVAIYNSIPTAEGTLQLAMEHTKQTIHNANVLIIGFGRIGITIARLFNQIGANVKVAARNTTDFARIEEMRLVAVHSDQLHNHADADIFINTIPHMIITEKIISNMKETALIIDLASSPGGCDFTAAKNARIKTIHALGLPGKVAPVTAGKIIANTIIDVLSV